MDLQRIITELLGQGASPAGTRAGTTPQGPRENPAGGLGGLLSGMGSGSLGDILGRMRPPMGGAAGAAAAGGLLGSVLGGRGGGGLLRTGGMAVVGMLAYRAYEQWKAQQPGQPATPAAGEFVQPDAQAEDHPQVLALVQAMVAAARADGTMDPQERERIFTEAERMQLGPADKAEMFRILDTPADPQAIAALARSEAHRAELYTASALIIGEAGAAERAYLDALAGALDLPPGLRQRLDAQAREAASLPPG